MSWDCIYLLFIIHGSRYLQINLDGRYLFPSRQSLISKYQCWMLAEMENLQCTQLFILIFQESYNIKLNEETNEWKSLLQISTLSFIRVHLSNKRCESLFYNFTDHYLTRTSMLQLWTKPIKHFHYRPAASFRQREHGTKMTAHTWPASQVRSYMKASSILDTKRYNTIKWTTWYMWWGYQTQKLFSKLNHLCLQIHQH